MSEASCTSAHMHVRQEGRATLGLCDTSRKRYLAGQKGRGAAPHRYCFLGSRFLPARPMPAPALMGYPAHSCPAGGSQSHVNLRRGRKHARVQYSHLPGSSPRSSKNLSVRQLFNQVKQFPGGCCMAGVALGGSTQDDCRDAA